MIYGDAEGLDFSWVHKELVKKHEESLTKPTKRKVTRSDNTIANISKFVELTSGEKMVIRMMDEIDLKAPLKENRGNQKTIGARKI